MENGAFGKVCRFGETESRRKIMVEEYVASFLQEIVKNIKEPQLIVFFGDGYECGGIRYYYLKGAASHKASGNVLKRMDEFYFQNVGKQYFEGMKGIGWYYLEKKDISILEILKNMKEQNFQDLKGYYVYFEKNEGMEDYIVHCCQKEERRMETPAVRSEKKSRKIPHLNWKKLLSGKKAPAPMLAVQILNMVSLCILIICCIIAVTTLNQYDKMKRLEETVTYLEASMEKDALEEKNLPEE